MILGAAPEDNFKPSPEATKLPNGWLAAGLNKVATALGGPLMSSRDGCLAVHHFVTSKAGSVSITALVRMVRGQR